MASPKKRRAENVDGDFFVDETCIDCDTCRWMAPETYDRAGEMARVHRQPETDEERLRALMALVSCPTASIGTLEKHPMAPVAAALPDLLAETEDGGVYHAGYHAESSFGAASYLVRRPAERGGNVLVDSPRFTKPLVRRVEEFGGVATLFLTHVDDVADHEQWVEHFGARRVMHAAERRESLAGVEHWIDGEDPVQLDEDLVAVPTPGHTRGSTCLLFRDRFLFTGDHLAWSDRLGHLIGFRRACWYDWELVVRSTERLREHRFEWVLPGHGRRCTFDAAAMRAELERCLDWMATA